MGMKNKYVKKLPCLEKFTYDSIKKILLECDNKTEFYTKHARLKRYADKMGWWNKLSKELPHKRKWTLESLKKESMKYKTRTEFMKNNISAYNSALKSEHYHEIIKHPFKYFIR